MGSVFGLDHDAGGPVEFGEDDDLGCSESDSLGGGGQGEDGASTFWVLLEFIHGFITFFNIYSAIYTYIIDLLFEHIVFQSIEDHIVMSKDQELHLTLNQRFNERQHSLHLSFARQCVRLQQ